MKCKRCGSEDVRVVAEYSALEFGYIETTYECASCGEVFDVVVYVDEDGSVRCEG